MSGVVGFVLAGGKSSRMGEDKALVDWGGKTLLDHALDRLREATSRAAAVSCAVPKARYADHGAPVFTDSVEGAGALGGVLTGLERLPEDADWGLFLAVDLPLVPVPLLRDLRGAGGDRHRRRGRRSLPSGPEPLCAIYGRAVPRAGAAQRGSGPAEDDLVLDRGLRPRLLRGERSPISAIPRRSSET